MPDQYVKLPDGSYAQFPESMSDDQIAQVIKGTAPHQDGESWGDRISSWLPTAGGVVGGVLGGIAGNVPGAVGGAALGGAVGETARLGLDKLRGKPSPSAGDTAMSVAKEAALQGGAELAGGAIGAVMKPAGEALMQTALKPGLRAAVKSVRAGETPRVVKTLLDEGVNVTPGGIEKLNRIISASNQEIKQAIASVPFEVNPYKVASRLGETAKAAATQVNPAADLNAVSRVGQEFLQTHGGAAIPGQTAQALKAGTYRQLGNKAYTGELKGATVEAQKALARGLKEEIESEFAQTLPGVKASLGLPGGIDIAAANAREGRAIEALDAVSRRVAVGGNNNPMGIASLAVSHPVTFLTAMMDRHPAVKSMLARGLYQSAGAAAKVSPQLIRAAVQAIATSPADTSSPSTGVQ